VNPEEHHGAEDANTPFGSDPAQLSTGAWWILAMLQGVETERRAHLAVAKAQRSQVFDPIDSWSGPKVGAEVGGAGTGNAGR